MRITMTQTKNGSDNGEPPKSYEEGETYDVSDRLASVFTGEGFAEYVAPEPVQELPPPDDEQVTEPAEEEQEPDPAPTEAEPPAKRSARRRRKRK